ncbi:MAG: hypothetical protein O7H40_11720 [Gammaproteobacteria bacterium]|nr:hypothetical protein [Gammaproteobacteria bacterium]
MFALVLRGGWGTYRLVNASDPSVLEFPDEQQYWMMAGSLRSGEGLRDELGFRATRLPLYPALLSVFAGLDRGVILAKAFHWVIGALAAVVIGLAAAVLFDRRVGLLAGVRVALDPFLIFFSSLLLTETFFILCLGALYAVLAPMVKSPEALSVSWRRWMAVGTVSALCVYSRESGLGLIAVLSCFLLVWQRWHRRAVAGTAVTWLIVVAALLPWGVRNHEVLGEWCWLTTRSGISLYDGVGPQATGASDLGPVKEMEAVRNLTETQWNRYFLDESLEAIRRDPLRVVKLAGTKLARMWNPIPNADAYQSGLVRAVSVVWVCPILLFCFVGVWHLFHSHGRLGSRVAVFLLLPAFYLSAVHCLFVGSVRYRLGAMPMIEILAAVGLLAVFDHLRKSRRMIKT